MFALKAHETCVDPGILEKLFESIGAIEKFETAARFKFQKVILNFQGFLR